MGTRDVTYQYFSRASPLHHANASHASIFQTSVLWDKYRTGTFNPDDDLAAKTMIATVINDIYLDPVPPVATEYDKYGSNARVATYAHTNNAYNNGLRGNPLVLFPGDATYTSYFSGILMNLKKTGAQGTGGVTLTDAHMEGLSNLFGLFVEQPRPATANTDWNVPNSIVYWNGTGNAGKVNNSLTGDNVTGLHYGGNSAGTVTLSEGGAQGGMFLSWDKTGRQNRMFQERGKGNGTVEFDPALVIANPDHALNKNHRWILPNLLLKLRRPEVDLLNISDWNIPLDNSVAANHGFVGVSDKNQVFALTNAEVSATNTDYQVTKYGVYSQTLQAEDAVLSGGTVTSTVWPNYTGASYVAYPNLTSGQMITWNYQPDFSGTAVLRFRYANGSGANRPLKLEVGTTVISSGFAFPANAANDWARWDTVSFTLNVTAGSSYAIRLSTATAVKGPNLDCMLAEVRQTGILQAEDAYLSGVTFSNYNAGYTGTGYGNYNHINTDYIEWSVYKANAGSASLTFTYANGYSTNRPLTLSVNGVSLGNVNFNPTYPSGSTAPSWTTWATTSGVNASLKAGDNKVRLTATNVMGVNMDKMAFTSSPSASPSARLITAGESKAEASSFGASVYPNPARGKVHVAVSSPSGAAVAIQLVNLMGQVHKKITFTPYAEASGLDIPVQGLAPGLYLVKVSQGTENVTVRVVIVH